MFFYNKKLGFYTQYYNLLFFSYVLPYQNQLKDFYKRTTSKETCLLVYPILYKKIFFLELSAHIQKKKKMNNKYNLNQTLILEGTVSSHKCKYAVPLFSFFNTIYLE